MNNNFDIVWNSFSEGTYLDFNSDVPTFVPVENAIPNIDEIGDEIERLRARCQFTSQQFFNGLALQINPAEADILIPELRGLVDKIFWVLNNTQKTSYIEEIKELVQCLLRIYEEGKSYAYKKELVENISILFKRYLLLYISINFHPFKGDMEKNQLGLVNPSPNDRDPLELMNKWVFYYGTQIVVRNFRNLLEAIYGKSFRDIKVICRDWEDTLVKILKKGYENLGFEEKAIEKLLKLTYFPPESFIKWVSSSWNYVFNENLVSTFTRYRQNSPDIRDYLSRIYESFNEVVTWVEKGVDPTPLLPILIILDTFSTEGFSGSKDDFDFFFDLLEHFYIWIVFHRCTESLLINNQRYHGNFIIFAEVRQKIENSVGSLSAVQINFLKQKFESYREMVEYFKNLLYEDEKSIPKESFVYYRRFSYFLEFILGLFSNIHEQNEYGDLFQLIAPENSMSDFFL